MSFREIAVTIRAINHASAEFNRIQTDAESLATRVRSLGAAIAGIGAAGTAVGYIANQFGILNDSQTRTFTSAMMVVSVMGMFMRTSAGVAVAQKVYSAATAVATARAEQPKHQLRNLPRPDRRGHSGHSCRRSSHVQLR
jgi:hypothetical protein